MNENEENLNIPPSFPELEIGCWIKSPEGEAVVVGIEGKMISYRYSATPFRDGKPMVLEQRWVLCTASKGAVVYLYPPNVVSIEVVKLKGPYGKDEPKIVSQKLPKEPTTWD